MVPPHVGQRVSRDVLSVLENCRSLELAMADFYGRLASLHVGSPTMAKLWRKTSFEENNHASQFTFAIESWRDIIHAVVVDMSVVDRTKYAIELLYKECDLRQPTPEEALKAAIAFEEQMTWVHMDKLAVFTDDGHRSLFQAMLAADRNHIGSMQAALRSLVAHETPVPVLRRSRRR
jgi:rubrerythrin